MQSYGENFTAPKSFLYKLRKFFNIKSFYDLFKFGVVKTEKIAVKQCNTMFVYVHFPCFASKAREVIRGGINGVNLNLRVCSCRKD